MTALALSILTYEDDGHVRGRRMPPLHRSPSRRDVLHLLCLGMTVEEIAAKRGRSPKPIANTVTVYRAFNVRNRAELLTELLRRGIIKPT